MKFWNFLGIALWITSLIYSSDGKGGGGSKEEEINPVTITAIGTAAVGNDVRLACEFSEVKQPESLYWFKENDIFYGFQDDVEYKYLELEVIDDNFNVTKVHTIIKRDLSLADDGIYKCLVKPKDGDPLEAEFPLVVAPHSKTVRSMETVLLECDHFSGNKPPLWKKDKTIVVFNDPRFSRYSRVGYNMKILNITESDEGTYTCYDEGKRADATTLIFYREPVPPELSSLRGWRGLLFGVLLGVLILLVLVVTCYMQHKPVAVGS